jgi:hypothetical protein
MAGYDDTACKGTMNQVNELNALLDSAIQGMRKAQGALNSQWTQDFAHEILEETITTINAARK